jgi:hypothetical protein
MRRAAVTLTAVCLAGSLDGSFGSAGDLGSFEDSRAVACVRATTEI